jgi:hypothetical protein
MTNTISYKDETDLFNTLLDHFDGEFSEFEHRRGSTFYVRQLIEVTQTDLDDLQLKDRTDLLGFWETNRIVWSDDDGFEYPPDMLYRVKPVKVLTTKYERVGI